MSTAATTDNQPLGRRAARRQETTTEIVAAAWELVREHGLAGLALRDLASKVGMKAPSLYSYFDSKHEIYDAMFLEGYLAFEAAIEAQVASWGPDSDPVDVMHAMAHAFFEFCTSDPGRYQLLFQRMIPDFEPSEESYAVAMRTYRAMSGHFAAFGITDPAAVDMWTAVLTGLTSQQISNDPNGDRWHRLVDDAVDMTLRQIAPDLLDNQQGTHS
jgi:AcrR family transcriptional regulator